MHGDAGAIYIERDVDRWKMAGLRDVCFEVVAVLPTAPGDVCCVC